MYAEGLFARYTVYKYRLDNTVCYDADFSAGDLTVYLYDEGHSFMDAQAACQAHYEQEVRLLLRQHLDLSKAEKRAGYKTIKIRANMARKLLKAIQ